MYVIERKRAWEMKCFRLTLIVQIKKEMQNNLKYTHTNELRTILNKNARKKHTETGD